MLLHQELPNSLVQEILVCTSNPSKYQPCFQSNQCYSGCKQLSARLED